MIIYKYSLALLGEQQLELPLGAKVISVMNQDDTIVVYALIDPDEQTTHMVTFYIKPTGRPFPEGGMAFLGTVSYGPTHSLVFHIFYKEGI